VTPPQRRFRSCCVSGARPQAAEALGGSRIGDVHDRMTAERHSPPAGTSSALYRGSSCLDAGFRIGLLTEPSSGRTVSQGSTTARRQLSAAERRSAAPTTSPADDVSTPRSQQRGLYEQSKHARSRQARGNAKAGPESESVVRRASRQPNVESANGRRPTRPSLLYRVTWRPAVAEIVGDGRPWRVLMISLLSMPCR
jgi:hypothetical protein